MEGIEDAIENAPVVDGLTRGVFGVDIGGAPFQGRGAIAGGQEIVDADVDRGGAEGGEFSEEFFAVGCVSVIGLVVAEIVPDGYHGPVGLVGMHLDPDGWRRCLRTHRAGREEQGQKRGK